MCTDTEEISKFSEKLAEKRREINELQLKIRDKIISQEAEADAKVIAAFVALIISNILYVLLPLRYVTSFSGFS